MGLNPRNIKTKDWSNTILLPRIEGARMAFYWSQYCQSENFREQDNNPDTDQKTVAMTTHLTFNLSSTT